MAVESEESSPQKFYATSKRKQLKKTAQRLVYVTILTWYVEPVPEELSPLALRLV